MSAEPLPIPDEHDDARGRSAFGRVRSRALLALVPPPERARRAPFVVLLLVLLAGGLVGLLLLNTASAQDSFRLHALQAQEAALQQLQQEYGSSADALADPARLASRASALGMVPGAAPIFLAPGAPIPAGAIRLGNLVYLPGPAPVPVAVVPPRVLQTPIATTTTGPKAAPTKPAAASTAKARTRPTARKTTVTRRTLPTRPTVPTRPIVPKHTAGAPKTTTAGTTAGTAGKPTNGGG